MQRGPRRPCRDADVVRPHRLGAVASPHWSALSFLAFPALRLPHTRPDIIALGIAALGIVIGVLLWIRRVRAEIRAAEGLPFLVPRGRSAAIVGAETDRPARVGAAGGASPRERAVAGPGLADRTPPPAPPPPLSIARATAPWPGAPASPRPISGPALTRPVLGLAPTPELPAIPLAGGVHAILVSAVAGPRAVRAPTVPALVRPEPAHPAADGADATLQLLPGRFEVAGAPRSRDIRFVRQPGPVTELTLGRRNDAAGSTDGHVGLDGPTVSRRHARLRYEGGRWTIANLSRTNPVRLNGRVLLETAGPQRLGEGDRVEVGEFLLVFRER